MEVSLWVTCVEMIGLSTIDQAAKYIAFLSTTYSQVSHRLPTIFVYNILKNKAFFLTFFYDNYWLESTIGVTIRGTRFCSTQLLK